MDQNQRYENAVLRIRVYANLDRYLGKNVMNPASLAELLGYKDKKLSTMKEKFSPHDIRLCQTLAGPYGYTIYRMLLAQNQPPK